MAVPQGLTDCKYFLHGYCLHGEDCRFRHCRQAVKKKNQVCFQWPDNCRNSSCRYLHPLPSARAPFRKTPQQANYPQLQRGSVSFFWDIENVHVPRAQNPSHIVQRLREKFVHTPELREIGFACYVCETSKIPRSTLVKLHHAGVRIVHVLDRKPGAVDRQILLDLDRFERVQRPPATIVLISSDIDYVGKLNDLRHQAGYHVIVVHNKLVNQDLWMSINAHYSWDTLTNIADIAFSDSSEPQDFGPSYQCPECTNNFRSLDALHQHQDTRNHLMECPACDGLFYTSNDLAKHQHATDHYLRNFACRRFYRSFSTRNQLKQDENDSHGLSNRNGPLIRLMIADYFLSLSKKTDPFCPECSAIFRTVPSLHQHQDAKQHKFNCPICDDAFYTSEEQKEHQEVENHFLRKCNVCNRVFRTHESLTQHKLDKFHQ